MSLQEQEAPSLAELDAADQQQVEQVEEVVLRVVADEHPATVSELSLGVRAQIGEVDNSVIRAAILRLLGENRLTLGNGHDAPAAQ